ncbi:hypothetical protein Tco_0999206 [Tanacetum coccineum]
MDPTHLNPMITDPPTTVSAARACKPREKHDSNSVKTWISQPHLISDLYHLKAYGPHAKRPLKKQEQSASIVDPLAYNSPQHLMNNLSTDYNKQYQANHGGCYDTDVGEGPMLSCSFHGQLSSTSTTNNQSMRYLNDNQIFDNVDYQIQEMHQEEHLDSDAETEIDDNTIPYHQYLLDTEAQNVSN